MYNEVINMFNAANKTKQYATILEHTYANLLERYIYDTFTPCIENPSRIAKWRVTTACNLLCSAQNAMNQLPFDYPQLSPNDLFKLSPEIFNEQMGNTAITSLEMSDAKDDESPSQIIKDLDRQICNNIRNEIVLSLNTNIMKGTKIGKFAFQKSVLKENEDAILNELNKTLGDLSLLW